MLATWEDTFVGVKDIAPGRSNAEEVHDMLTVPNQPDYVAWTIRPISSTW